MCTQVNTVYACGCRAFYKVEPCKKFPKTCAGTTAKHRDEHTSMICGTHELRQQEEEAGRYLEDPHGKDDPYKKHRKDKKGKKKA